MGAPDYLRGLFEEAASINVGEVLLEAGDDPVHQREQLARVVLDQMYQFVALLDPAGNLLEVNRAALAGGGIKAEDIIGKPLWLTHWWTVSRETQEQLKQAIARAAAGEFVHYDVEVYGEKAGSETITIDFSLLPVRDRHGKVVFLLPEGRNIAEKKRAEAEIARKNAELERLLERVREFDELKSQFFANVSHELRTPLALILGPTERLLAENGSLSLPQRRDLEVVQRNAAILLKQVNHLLDLSKLDARKMKLAYAEVDLAHLVRTVASHFDALAPQRNIAWVVEAPPQLKAQVDPEKLERTVLNLLSNAFKFTPSGGKVRCALAATGDGHALLTVQDTGPGVRSEMRQRIFERFQQAEGDSTRKLGGTGLGLAIVKEFVELHQGTVAVTDAPGGGALFQVTLPLVAPAGAHVGAAEGHEEPVTPAAGGFLEELRPADVAPLAPEPNATALPLALVVEDNPEMLRFVAESLAGAFRVAMARSGREGLEKGRALHPDVIVTDVMMPEMRGDQMVATVRSDPELDAIPILVLSARADATLRLALLRGGAQDYVVKPFAPEELCARARNLAMLKRVRQRLEAEMATRSENLELLTKEVLQQKRQLQTALDETLVARERAEEAAQIREYFLQLVSHELRTPITSVGLTLDLLRSRGAHRGNERLFERLASGTKRLDTLVSNLLEWARIESGRLTIEAEPLDPAVIAAEVIEELEPMRQRPVVLRLDVSPELGLFWMDARLIRLIFSNLLGNALKYTPEGEVALSLRREGEHLLVTVSDTGPGIPEGDRRRVFEPFAQLQPIHQKSIPGVGLGLALVREIVEALAGSLELSCPPDGGSRFAVKLPSHTAAAHLGR